MWCIADSVLPENSIRKYSAFVYGLVIISLTVSLFAKFDFNDIGLSKDLTDTGEYNNTYLKNLYEDRLENVLSEKFGDGEIKVELTDDYHISKISCSNQKTYDDIMGYLNE